MGNEKSNSVRLMNSIFKFISIHIYEVLGTSSSLWLIPEFGQTDFLSASFWPVWKKVYLIIY